MRIPKRAGGFYEYDHVLIWVSKKANKMLDRVLKRNDMSKIKLASECIEKQLKGE
jgi:hypothetical protein